MYRLKLVTAGSEPVTTAEAKAYARVEHSDEDTLFENWIKVARAEAERVTGRQLTTSAAWRLTLDSFSEIRLPRPPLLTVASITYLDGDGASQTLATSVYQVDTDAEPGCVRLAYGEIWPTTLDHPGAVTINYTAGWASASAVPEEYKDAIKEIVAWKYRNRQAAEIPEAYITMLAAHWHGWSFLELVEV